MTQQTRSYFSFQKTAESPLQKETAYRLSHNNKSIKPAGDEYSITQHQIKTSNEPSLTMPLTLADSTVDTSQEMPSLASTFTGDGNSDGAASGMTAEAVSSPRAGDMNTQPGLIASAVPLAIGAIGIGAGASALAGASHSARNTSSHAGLQNWETHPQRQPVAPSSPASDTENTFDGQPQRLEHEHQDASRNSLIDSKDVELMTSAGNADSTPQTADPARIALSETVDFINQAKRMGVILGDMAPVLVNAPQGLFIDSSVQLERMTDGSRSSVHLGLNQHVFITFAGSASSASTVSAVGAPSLPALPFHPGHESGNDTPADPNAGSGANNQPGGSDSTGGSASSGSEQPAPGKEQQQPDGQQNQDGNPQSPSGNQQGPSGTLTGPDAGSQGQGEGQRSQVPQYPSQREPIAVEHDQQKTLDASVFRGEVEGRQPQWVRIESIVNKNGEAAESGALLNGTQPLDFHSVIAREDFDKVKWDASKSNGGSFKFVVVTDKFGTGVADGVAEQTVTINEDAEPAPSYGSESLSAPVAHNQNLDFSSHAEHFKGSGNTKATHIKITEIKKDASGTDADDENTLKYNEQPVKENTVIDLAQLSKLVWDASKAVGGSFKFTPVKDNGDAYEASPAAQAVTM